MPASGPGLARAVRWYAKGGLFDAVSAALAALVLLGLWQALGQAQDPIRAQWLWLVLDFLLWPLYALQAAMHVVRDEKTTVFEINLMGGPLTVALGRLLALLLSQAPVGAAAYLAIAASGARLPPVAVAVKVALYLAATALALPLMSRRSSLFLLLALLVLLPFTVPVVVGAHAALGAGRLDPATAVAATAVAPFYMYYADEVLPLPYDALALAALALLALLTAVSVALFVRAEYGV